MTSTRHDGDTVVFVNPSARKGRSSGRTTEALEALTRFSPRTALPRVLDTQSVAELRDRAAEEVERGAARIVVIGGDGLAHHVVQAVAGSDTVLAIIPVGTGNDVAGALGLPRQPTEAARVALGPDRSIDLLRCSGTWALSVATTGFSAAVNERAEAMSWPRGASRYSLATLLELPRLRPTGLVLSLEPTDGGATVEHRVHAALVAVGNTALFGGGMRICPAADPADGVLDITLIDAVGRLDLMRHFGRVFRGTHIHHPAVSVYRARAVTLEATGAGRVPVRADGEAWGELPCRIEAVPHALRIAAPADTRTAAR